MYYVYLEPIDWSSMPTGLLSKQIIMGLVFYLSAILKQMPSEQFLPGVTTNVCDTVLTVINHL